MLFMEMVLNILGLADNKRLDAAKKQRVSEFPTGLHNENLLFGKACYFF